MPAGLRRGLVLAALVAATWGPASATPFAIRTAGAATALAIDEASVSRTGWYRTGWTYEFLRERNPFASERTQIIGILELVDCRSGRDRRLQVVHYRASGAVLWRTKPKPAWSDALRGSNTDLLLRALCGPPDDVWARRQAANVFALYGAAWSR